MTGCNINDIKQQTTDYKNSEARL